MRWNIALGVVVFALAFGLAGCAEKRVVVTGRVTYNGAPLDKPGGEIVFVSESGVQVPAAIALDGTFRAANVVVGANRVAVYYKNSDYQPKKKKHSKRPPDQQESAPVSPFLTPMHYAAIETSELSLVVAEGSVFNRDLTGPPIP